MIVKTHYIISKIVDGDSIIIKNIFTSEEIEIRLYGIDAPESKYCQKLINDERETHLPGQFLIKLGVLSTKFLRNHISIGESCTIIQEEDNMIDVYGRTLAYLILPDGKCVNELMVKNGYAKPYNKVYCTNLPLYQELNLKAKQENKGLYSLTNSS